MTEIEDPGTGLRDDDQPRLIVHEPQKRGDKPFWLLLLIALAMLAGIPFVWFLPRKRVPARLS